MKRALLAARICLIDDGGPADLGNCGGSHHRRGGRTVRLPVRTAVRAGEVGEHGFGQFRVSELWHMRSHLSES